jgi:hypothetical protein
MAFPAIESLGTKGTLTGCTKVALFPFGPLIWLIMLLADQELSTTALENTASVQWNQFTAHTPFSKKARALSLRETRPVVLRGSSVL